MINFERLAPKIQHAILTDSLTYAVWNKHVHLGVHTINKRFLEDLAVQLLGSRDEMTTKLLDAYSRRPIIMNVDIPKEAP